MVCFYCDLMWRVWKEEKVKEIKGRGRSAIWRRVKREKSHQMRLRTKVLSSRTAWVKASKREKNRAENRKYTVKKRATSEKRMNFFLFLFLFIQVYFCCNIYLIEWNYSEFVRWFFLEKECPHKRFTCWNLFIVNRIFPNNNVSEFF